MWNQREIITNILLEAHDEGLLFIMFTTFVIVNLGFNIGISFKMLFSLKKENAFLNNCFCFNYDNINLHS